MLAVCDFVRKITHSCASTDDSGGNREFSFAQGREDTGRRAVTTGTESNGLTLATNAGTGSSTSSSMPSHFNRVVEKVTKLKAATKSKDGKFKVSIEKVLGVQLSVSSRRDYRACVDLVLPHSEAEALSIQVGAVISSVNGESMKGHSLEHVEECIHKALESDAEEYVEVEFLQRVHEMRVDRNPYEMTKFPSPQGTRLPGVQLLYEHQEEDESSDDAEAPATQRRERSRSLKHFWMSDRSAKACYECEKLFTFFRRRHHCRSCGQIFCSQCCARLPQSFGSGSKEDESITRLRKQLVCHTCHRQLREGLELEIANTQYPTRGPAKTGGEIISPVSQTLLLMPPHIAEALEKSSSDLSTYKNLDKGEQLFDKDEITDDSKFLEQQEKNRSTALFSMFPKVQIMTSVQHLAHFQPRLHHMSSKELDQSKKKKQMRRTCSEPMILFTAKESQQEELFRSFNRLKRSNSLAEIGNPSLHRWSEAEFKRFIEESNAEALRAGENPKSRGRGSLLTHNRPKALSATFAEADAQVHRFGGPQSKYPFMEVPSDPDLTAVTKAAVILNAPARPDSNTDASVASGAALDNEKPSGVLPQVVVTKDAMSLASIGLSNDPKDDTSEPIAVMKKEEALSTMSEHARARIEERIFHFFEKSTSLSQLPIMEQHRWMQLLNMFAHKAALHISCRPDVGDNMDIMEYVRIKSFQGGRVQDSFFIEGVLVHKSLARKGMRSDIENPRILLIASELDYQRKKEAIASLESVAGQEVEYMHIVAEKIMTLHPDIVLFGGHVHRVAEEILFKHGIVVIKNVRLVDLQRIARSTGASLLSSYDHVDKISENEVIGTCQRFYVMISDQEPRSIRRSHMDKNQAGANARVKKRVQRQNIVFEGGVTSRGCTICLRGGSVAVLNDISEAIAMTIRAAYNMRLQRTTLVSMGYLPPRQVDEQDRSVAEDWFAKYSTSLYVSLKSNSLSLRAALKETQAMCKYCKENTRFNNISSLRVLGSDSRRNSEAAAYDPEKENTGGGCTCSSSRPADAQLMRDRILFSTCWSSLQGNTASQAEMMCIDFYSSNDCSMGQFLEKYCFTNDRELRRAFLTSRLSFSHDNGRLILCVKDITDGKAQQESFYKQQTAALELRELAQKHLTVMRLIGSEQVLMWSRSVEDGTLSSTYSFVPDDLWNYSFGKFLEDMFYGKSMEIDLDRFPHLKGLRRGSRDSCLVHYFSRNGRIVSIQCEPLEPVLHVALQPALWQDHVDPHRQLADAQELCALAEEVFFQTTTKITESMNDMVTPLHAKHHLKILKNEVQQWYTCYSSKIEANPPEDMFEKNAYFKVIYKHAAEWSLRITQAMHATVKIAIKPAENSPKSALPKAWFEQFAGAMNSGENETTSLALNGTQTQEPDLSVAGTPLQFQQTVSDQAGNLENLAKFAKSLASGEVSTPNAQGFRSLSNEVAKTLSSSKSEDAIRLQGTSTLGTNNAAARDQAQAIEILSPPVLAGSDSTEGSSSFINQVGTASTLGGSYSSRMALEAFRRAQTSVSQSLINKKVEEWGTLSIPKRLLAWHPSLPSGVQDTVILVNAAQPTSVVAYSLCSQEYTAQLNDALKCERVAPMNAVQNETKGKLAADAAMLSLLRSGRRSNVDHAFVDENQFQSATRFSCKSYYAMQFHALRRLYYGGDRNFVESLCHCEQWNAAGGKSGAGFLKTQDQRFIAKVIPPIELQMFLSMANEYFAYMARTFETNLSSMLSKVLGIYKVTISSEIDQTMCIIVMENLIYGRDVNFSFDLKGKMEGRYKHNRAENQTATKEAPSTVLWDRNFVEMAGGIPLPLQESAMSLLLSAIVNDTTFLASVQATDYSMLVGYDVRKQELVACIIDYIHKYDFLKMVEHAGKRLIQDEREITVLNPKQYRKRFCQAMTKYFTTIPSRYTKVTTVVRTPVVVATTPIDDEESHHKTASNSVENNKI